MAGVSAEHYFSATPQAPARATEVEFSLAGRDFRLVAAGGVFSAARLDPGTAVLLRKAELPGPQTTGRLLDLGCGYGPIHAVDVNSRAVELTRANAQALGLAGRVVASGPDDVAPDLTFAQIWSNPPIRVGKAELHALLERWLPRLAPDGLAWLVVARHLGADSLADWLRAGGWAVQRRASQQGFRVLTVAHQRKSGDADGPDEGHS
jgi:16S rRNA G1207 methylase RsmC